MREKKFFVLMVIVCAMILIFNSCACEHQWQDATCSTPKQCSICEEVEGEPLEHKWQEANCTEPKTCSLCSITDGEPVGHVWKEATCTEPKTCSICNKQEGNLIDHVWREDCKICVSCGVDERSTDEKFMESLATGLEARWILADANDDKEILTKADWEKYFAAEYDQIIEYESASFENKDLEKWARAYIDSIVRSKEVLAYYGTNQWDSKYHNGVYHDRTVALYKIHDIVPIPVAPENQESLLGLLSNGETIDMVNALFDLVQFEKVEESYGWKTYEAIVENTTTQTFDYFSFDIDLIDEDGVTITTVVASVDNWSSGEKIRFTFSTEEVFSELNVDTANWS